MDLHFCFLGHACFGGCHHSLPGMEVDKGLGSCDDNFLFCLFGTGHCSRTPLRVMRLIRLFLVIGNRNGTHTDHRESYPNRLAPAC